jgi:hypothetical protein
VILPPASSYRGFASRRTVSPVILLMKSAGHRKKILVNRLRRLRLILRQVLHNRRSTFPVVWRPANLKSIRAQPHSPSPRRQPSSSLLSSSSLSALRNSTLLATNFAIIDVESERRDNVGNAPEA